MGSVIVVYDTTTFQCRFCLNHWTGRPYLNQTWCMTCRRDVPEIDLLILDQEDLSPRD